MPFTIELVVSFLHPLSFQLQSSPGIPFLNFFPVVKQVNLHLSSLQSHFKRSEKQHLNFYSVRTYFLLFGVIWPSPLPPSLRLSLPFQLCSPHPSCLWMNLLYRETYADPGPFPFYFGQTSVTEHWFLTAATSDISWENLKSMTVPGSFFLQPYVNPTFPSRSGIQSVSLS